MKRQKSVRPADSRSERTDEEKLKKFVLYIDFVGDVARVYINDKQVNDYYYNGAEWILGVSRYRGLLEQNPLIIKIKGFKTGDEQIYLERHIDRKKCIHPKIVHMEWKPDYRFSMNYFELIE